MPYENHSKNSPCQKNVSLKLCFFIAIFRGLFYFGELGVNNIWPWPASIIIGGKSLRMTAAA
jgi:hypothetical protein